ncbi:MAG TPA: DUF4173 domain-containing protein [Bacteroidia bacterium]|nr:DUF4173 domain-containing protein [Bacteroidia bacterium]HNU32989.1 DUF4173 domain-containing protein [Bacteroidia bacterium]
MLTRTTNILLTIFALIIYNYLFWHEKLGVNLLLFTSLLALMLIYLNKENLKHTHIKLLVASTFLTGVLAVVNNSGISKFTHIISFVLLTGSLHATGLRALYNILTGALANYILTPFTFYTNTTKATEHIKPMRKFFYWSKLLLLPTVVFLLFFIIYNEANTQFGSLFNGLYNLIEQLFETLYIYISLPRTIFLVFGLVLIRGTLHNKYFGFLLSRESSLSDYISRRRMKNTVSKRNFLNFPINALRKELKSGALLLAALNIILFTLNVVDIKLLWFGFYPQEQFNMKAFVHEGTFLLILSIILSMIVILYFFRRNQNFNSNNKTLKILSYAWIIQNMVLLISVCLRNHQYIFYNGLAYKRIGLYAFLLLTLIGLLTLMIKVKQLKSHFYLLRVNTWAAYCIFILLSVFNWDMLIARTNLANENGSGIDIDFYLELSLQTYPLIIQNLQKVEKQIAQHHASGVRWTNCNSIEEFKKALSNRKYSFLKSYYKYSWQSWNYSDYNAINNLSYCNENLSLSENDTK